MGDVSEKKDESAEGAGPPPEPRRGSTRRALLIGGAAAGLGAAVLARDQLGRLWWRLPGVVKKREEGAVDAPGAQWTAASGANWRRADRPSDYAIDRVVIHVVQGGYATALKVFKDPGHGAATHYVIRKDGHVAQMIRELDVAYHAGDREMNERSVGIEHEGFVDKKASFTDAMYASSARLTAGICERYDIPVDREHIIGHVEVDGTDHTDPGPHWDWDRYLRLVRRARDRPARSGASATPS
ncbi:N-acetylmuramoyl-L-alanine amidase [Streptomyces spectabilis]|uniref:N-acetylmuramoyl-L-alanine amidase n=1 Tax=Streptomyces spectabilis TaxID=68270 RepID=A0A5P2XF06_STRST|nr:N-acetylmuramoyl-L-alanine amidase [Streptomyces spectabilis]MCI3905302.1 N-acetylmuramoyl-L-alanine amidase [Streptomyces spectabilis]QEV62304.1 N-acetylmuramoyl-L-alanine amidase [Streptomyces spectabilis]GGU99333.1 N-acetylmuramoyl-L-alanine amidase [Streptomyces spectabilis]